MNETNLPTRVLTTLLLPAPGAQKAVDADRESFEEALWYAKAVGAEIRLLHILDEAMFPVEVTKEEVGLARDAAHARLDELARSVTADGVKVSYEVRAGLPWLETIRSSREWKADLIVAGSRRRTSRFFANALFGSTSRRLLRKADVPVWVARDTGDPPITNVAVAVDMSLPLTARLLELGEGLRQSVGARLHLVHSLPYKKAYYSLEEGSLERRSAREARDAEVRSVMHELRAILGDAIDHWDVRIGEGPVVADLGQVVEQRGIDLLVMGSVSRAGVPGLIVGNTAESVFARIDCPLWVIKPEGWVSPVPHIDDKTVVAEKTIR